MASKFLLSDDVKEFRKRIDDLRAKALKKPRTISRSATDVYQTLDTATPPHISQVRPQSLRFSHAEISSYSSKSRPTQTNVHDENWIHDEHRRADRDSNSRKSILKRDESPIKSWQYQVRNQQIMETSGNQSLSPTHHTSGGIQTQASSPRSPKQLVDGREEQLFLEEGSVKKDLTAPSSKFLEGFSRLQVTHTSGRALPFHQTTTTTDAHRPSADRVTSVVSAAPDLDESAQRCEAPPIRARRPDARALRAAVQANYIHPQVRGVRGPFSAPWLSMEVV